jgi:hypothetical protein
MAEKNERRVKETGLRVFKTGEGICCVADSTMKALPFSEAIQLVSCPRLALLGYFPLLARRPLCTPLSPFS